MTHYHRSVFKNEYKSVRLKCFSYMAIIKIHYHESKANTLKKNLHYFSYYKGSLNVRYDTLYSLLFYAQAITIAICNERYFYDACYCPRKVIS